MSLFDSFLGQAKGLLAPHVFKAFEAISEDELRFSIGFNLPIFPKLPKETAESLLDRLRPYSIIIRGLDSIALAGVILELIREQRPDFGFITQDWLAVNIDELKRLL